MNNSKDLIKTISSDSIELITEYSEVAIDAFIESKVIQDIPIFGSIAKLSKIGISIRDYLFIEKLKSFLLTLNKVSEKERKKFIEKHLTNDEKINIVGEKIFNVIDKIDTTQKAKYIGKIFNLYIQEIITEIEFYDLIYSIENFKIHYTNLFINSCINIESLNNNTEAIEHFITCGLFRNKENKSTFLYTENEIKYSSNQITMIGKLFLEKIIEYDKEKTKRDFIDKILNIEVFPIQIDNNWEFIEKISKIELEQQLIQKSLLDFLEIQYRSSFVTIKQNGELIGIFNNNDFDKFSVYKRKKNYD